MTYHPAIECPYAGVLETDQYIAIVQAVAHIDQLDGRLGLGVAGDPLDRAIVVNLRKQLLKL